MSSEPSGARFIASFGHGEPPKYYFLARSSRLRTLFSRSAAARSNADSASFCSSDESTGLGSAGLGAGRVRAGDSGCGPGAWGGSGVLMNGIEVIMLPQPEAKNINPAAKTTARYRFSKGFRLQ